MLLLVNKGFRKNIWGFANLFWLKFNFLKNYGKWWIILDRYVKSTFSIYSGYMTLLLRSSDLRYLYKFVLSPFKNILKYPWLVRIPEASISLEFVSNKARVFGRRLFFSASLNIWRYKLWFSSFCSSLSYNFYQSL